MHYPEDSDLQEGKHDGVMGVRVDAGFLKTPERFFRVFQGFCATSLLVETLVF